MEKSKVKLTVHEEGMVTEAEWRKQIHLLSDYSVQKADYITILLPNGLHMGKRISAPAIRRVAFWRHFQLDVCCPGIRTGLSVAH